VSLTRQRGRTARRGLAVTQARIAQEAHAALLDEYLTLYRARQAEAVRARKRAIIFSSPAATARLLFLERQEQDKKALDFGRTT
jgi:hypothetical protein